MQYELIELFEAGAADGRQVLEITGEDVASFADELVANLCSQVSARFESGYLEPIGKNNSNR